MERLDERELDALQQFRTNVSDVLKPIHVDGYLLQWLTAKNFDIQQAESAFRQSLAWRESVGADIVLESWDPPEVLRLYYTQGLVGHDKEGCPVWIFPHGRLDLKGLISSADKEDMMYQVIHQMESSRAYMAEQSERLGRYIYQHVVIIDMEGLTFLTATYKPGLDVFHQLSQMQEENYPETLKKCFTINAPRFFAFIYGLIKPLLNEGTRKKVEVFDSDRSKWVPALLEMIDPSQLPEYWGGTMVDPDGNGRCPSKVPMGGEIPTSYYKSRSRRSSDVGLEQATVKNGDILKLDLEVVEPNSKIRWAFQTENHDIGFVVKRQQSHGWLEVVPYSRRDSHGECIEGETQPLEIGKYAVTFDNTYSKLRSKSISYAVEVVRPTSR